MQHTSNGLLIKQLHDNLERQANNHLRHKDLTIMQVAVLENLRSSETKQLPMKVLEHHFQVAQSTIAGIISRLEQKGLVEAAQDASNKRIKLARITPAGEICCDESVRYQQEAEETLLKGFSTEERAMFNALLTRALDNVKK